MKRKIVHLVHPQLHESEWVHSLQTVVMNRIGSEEHQQRWRSSELPDLGSSIGIKMKLAELAGREIHDLLNGLTREVLSRESEFRELLGTETAFHAGLFPFYFLRAFDSFIFEIDSLLDVVKKFTKGFLKVYLDVSMSTSEINKKFSELESRPFYDLLNRMRNFLAHQGNYWPALQEVPDNPNQFDIILLSSMIASPKDKISLRECDEAVGGMKELLSTVYKWLDTEAN